MEILYMILQRAINLQATDIHLANDMLPVYRVNKKLYFDESKLPLSEMLLNQILDAFLKLFQDLKMNSRRRNRLTLHILICQQDSELTFL